MGARRFTGVHWYVLAETARQYPIHTRCTMSPFNGGVHPVQLAFNGTSAASVMFRILQQLTIILPSWPVALLLLRGTVLLNLYFSYFDRVASVISTVLQMQIRSRWSRWSLTGVRSPVTSAPRPSHAEDATGNCSCMDKPLIATLLLNAAPSTSSPPPTSSYPTIARLLVAQTTNFSHPDQL